MYEPPLKINDKLNDAVAEISDKLDVLRNSLSEEMFLELQKTSMIKRIHATCAMAGNALTLEQVEMIINDTYVCMDEPDPHKEESESITTVSKRK